MKINFLMLAVLILFITGCTIATTGNVVIEEGVDESGNVVVEEVKEEPVEEEENETTTTTTTIQETVSEETTTTTTPEIIGEVINIENLKFNPETLTISKGDTVTWVHKDKYVENMKHMVRIYPGGDAGPIMFYGEAFSYTFEEAGEYTAIDVIYKKKNVKGKIIVE